MFKHPKGSIKLAAQVLPLLTKATTEEKITLARTDAVPRPIEDHKLFKKIWILASRHIVIKAEGEGENGQGSLGP